MTELELATERLRQFKIGVCLPYMTQNQLIDDQETLVDAYLDQQAPVVLDWPDAEGYWWMETLAIRNCNGQARPISFFNNMVSVNQSSYRRDQCETWQPLFIRANVPVFPAREA